MPKHSQQNVNIIDSTVGRITQKITQHFWGNPSEQQAQRNRDAMLKLVKNIWVTGVLEHSLHGAVLLELGLEEKKEAVEHPWDMVLQMPDKPNRQLTPETPIGDVFNEMNQRLLILGDPGSGKTTTLLELTRKLILQAEDDPAHPIPVVFNLSSWAGKQQSIEGWLVGELNSKYNIPNKIACPWVEHDQLLLLLDGLDEVMANVREKCVYAINAFLQKHFVPLVICSRTNEYENFNRKLRLQNAVCLQPLTPEQIGKYLCSLGPEFEAVRITIEEDPPLHELAQSPMMLSVMTLAYQGAAIEDIQVIDSLEERRKHIFNAYIRNMFKRRSANKRYLPQSTVRRLSWLAQKMQEHSQTVFLIERLQPTWLPTFTHIQYGGVLLALLVGMVVGMLWGVLAGLSVGLFCGLIWVRTMQKIEPIETLKWSWNRAKRIHLLTNLIVGLIIGAVLGGFVGLYVGLAVGLYAGLAVGLALWLGLVGLVVLAGGITGGVEDEAKTKIIPNQGIRHSIKNSLIVGMSVGLGSGLFAGLLTLPSSWPSAALTSGVIVGLFGGLGGGLWGGGFAVIQHYTLHFILFLKGYTPWNIAKFLDYATERIFLRKVGGGYMFIHRLLLEHFAELDPERITETKST
ncbi:MAG: NACHT domain-containing protein [bacterium]|nr:NACHT domain-containing protein [bacterium]